MISEQFCVPKGKLCTQEQICMTGKQFYVPREQLCNREHFCVAGSNCVCLGSSSVCSMLKNLEGSSSVRLEGKLYAQGAIVHSGAAVCPGTVDFFVVVK